MDNQPGDAHEQEADRVAEQVMRMPERVVQRACACGGTCGHCGGEDEVPSVQRKADTSAGATSAPSRSIVVPPGGRPLDRRTRSFFEPRFGADFSQVRVHTDAAAQQSAQDVNANAYTAGQNIVFGTGRFAPETQEGRRLLAHELTHVVQQSAHSPQGIVQRQMCTDILNAEEVPGVTRGVEVESAVRVDLITQLGAQNIAQGLSIPGASSRLYRMEECGGFQSTQPPGTGFPDLAFRRYPQGRTVELAEVKIGTWPCLYLAERQVDNYVELANGNEDYKRQLGVDHFEEMPTSRFAPTQLRDPITGTPVNVAWCSPGVIVYKAVAGDDKEEDEEPKDEEPPSPPVPPIWVRPGDQPGSSETKGKGGDQPGEALAWYVVMYDVGRFCFEFVRGDPSRPYRGGFSEAQWTSLLLMLFVVGGEWHGILPFHAWHVAATAAMLIIMIAVAVTRRLRRAQKHRLLHPRHIREVAEALERISSLPAEALPRAPAAPAAVPVACTSLGIQLSTGSVEEAGGPTAHYTFSMQEGMMPPEAAGTLAALLLRLRHPAGSSELIAGSHGVYT